MQKAIGILGAAVLTLVLALTSPAHAVQLTVDTDKLDAKLTTQLLEAQKEAAGKKDSAITVTQQAKEWAGIGKEIGSAFAETAKALSVETNQFIQTPVGKWTLFFVGWYLIGHKLWAIVAGIVIWITLGHFIHRSFRYFHVPRDIVKTKKDGTTVTEHCGYNFRSDEARAVSAFFHAATFVLFSVIMTIVILH